jgi:hypothetical protein
VPKITPARLNAHAPHAITVATEHLGWCSACYQAGSFTLSPDADGRLCAVHGALNGPESSPAAASSPGTPGAAAEPSRPSRPPRGPASGPGSGPGRRPRRARAARRLAARLYGRRRAAARVDAGTYRPHPGVENFLPPGRCRDQAVAAGWVRELVATQGWRRDRADAWTAVLLQLVYAMDWQSGLVSAVTAARLAAAAGRSTRTVSSVIAWAVAEGLLIVAERPASAVFLGSRRGRTPTYAVYRPLNLPRRGAETQRDREDLDAGPVAETSALVTNPAAPSCDLPLSSGSNYPSQAQGHDHPQRRRQPWLLYQIPETPSEREAALDRLLQRLGLHRREVSARLRWQARGLLRSWWDAGASPAGLEYAIHHHPDHSRRRGSARDGAHNLIAVLGARLRPWRGRLHELPTRVLGHRGDYRSRSTCVRSEPKGTVRRVDFAPTSSATHRAALREGFAAHRATRPRERQHQQYQQRQEWNH